MTFNLTDHLAAAWPEGKPSPTGYTLAEVEKLSIYELLHLWRTAPVGTFHVDDPVSDRWQVRMTELHVSDPAAWVSASRALRS